MKLSPHFTLDELTISETAARRGWDNTPTEIALENLRKTCEHMEAVRAVLGNQPIVVTSGYRSPFVNSVVGGSRTSQHMTGQAVDFLCPGYGSPAQICERLIDDPRIQYDQLIHEHGRWVHISFTDMPRRQALVIDRTGTRSMRNG